MQEVPLPFALAGKQSWQRSRPGAVQEAGGEGPQLAQRKAGWVTALGKGFAQGVQPGEVLPYHTLTGLCLPGCSSSCLSAAVSTLLKGQGLTVASAI